MIRRLAWTILFFPILLSFYGDKSDAPREDIKKLYKEAERLYAFENSTDSTYNLSLNYFCALITKLENDPDRHDYDSLLFHAYLKKGILLDVVKTKYAEASQSYCQAIHIQQTTGKQISDSLLFMAYNYAGACYYNMNNFDSASLFLLKAQQLIEKFPAMPEKERLYNTLGVLYYDNGNYIQSKNYFNQALDILHSEQPHEHNASVSIETNIATSLYRLGLYKEAIAKYEGILKYHVYGNYIYMNMGRANAALNKYQEAMNCFRKVKALELPGVYNEMAFSEMHLNHLDSAAYYLDALKHSRSNKLSLLDIGVNELYKSDLLNRQGQQESALKGLQQSIGIFSGHFNDSSIASNPSDFTGTYTYSWLFEALFRKATTLQSLYAVNHMEAYLLNAFNTYKTTLTLLAYIEKSYDTDDAKLFLKKKSWQVYRQALELSLALNQLHPGDKYLEEAFLISEKNKASIVAANLQEKTISLEAGSEAHWIQEERNIKYNIARLNVNSDQSQDSRTIEANAREKSRYEIELAELQKKNEQDHRYHKIKYQDNYPSIPELQQRLISKQAMISFYISGKILHAFILTQNEFKYVKIDSFQAIQTAVDNWLMHLRTAEPGRKFSPGQTGNFLHQHLIQPLQEQLAGKDEWIIIPDGILYFLPFESLPADHENRFLLETTAISYQFSSRFVEKGGSNSIFASSPNKVLAFAPFVHTKPLPGQSFQGQLPASADEVAGLRGNKYMDSYATKARFLQEINKYPIVHLATHAVSDVHNASASFIAFYPQKKLMAEDCLFLEELYGLNMDATQLMIISACETGKGELVNNEGVISIARAFTYAGCASVINSLWKTDDRATSAILKQFHVYLQHGFSKSRALQQAKLDFIKGNAIYRSPEYWSPLILIGNAEPLYPSDHTHRWAILLAGSVGFVIVAVANWRRRKNKK